MNAFVQINLEKVQNGDIYRYDGHFFPQHLYIKSLYPGQRVEVLRTESLEKDFECLVRRYGLPANMVKNHKEISRANESPSQISPLNFTFRTVELMEQVYREDFEVLDYRLLSR